MSRFANRTVLITGSSRGMGAATAAIVVAEGGNVILHGHAPSEQLAETAKQLDAPFITCDAGDRDGVHAAVAQAQKDHGPIHALVNSAGRITPKPFLKTTEADWNRDCRVNIYGTAWFCQAVLPAMVEAGYGRIVNLSSIRGLTDTASARAAHYSTSKAAVVNLTACLAKEFAPAVNVNCVAPGFIDTDMAQTWSPEMWEIAKTSLVGRVAQAGEVAAVIAFLASEEAVFVTGQTIAVDGGYGMSNK